MADFNPSLSSMSGGIASSAGVLGRLHNEAQAIRAKLGTLNLQLAQVERDIGSDAPAAALGADERLTHAADLVHGITMAASQQLALLVCSSGISAFPQLVTQAPATPSADDELRELRTSNQRLLMAALESRKQEATAKAAYQGQIAFLATVAHELRNPLMPLRLAAQMLGRARTDEEAYGQLQATISGQVATMSRLINDLLDGSRISTGKFRLERTIVDIASILALTRETCQGAVDERRHVLTIVQPSSPVHVLGDRMRLVQIMVNLLGNAVKYTPEGGAITVTAAVGARVMTLTVADNGIGIAPEALPHVFDLYSQDDKASLDHPGGLGIGLAVVRELVKAHEGTVVARSAGHNTGSEFIVTLPLATVGTP